jgi:predicted amidophosphoribosyltransferase
VCKFHGLIDFLFPSQCAACNAIGDGLCGGCAPRDAPALRRALPTLRVSALGDYAGVYRRAALALKDGRRDVGEALGKRLAALIAPGALLVPVTTTRARRWARGFDGVALLAKIAATRAGASVAPALVPRGIDAQRGRNRADRIAAHGRFVCREDIVRGRTVVLVDDVCTTGSTLEDCAATLRAAGATVTQALVVASANRGE